MFGEQIKAINGLLPGLRHVTADGAKPAMRDVLIEEDIKKSHVDGILGCTDLGPPKLAKEDMAKVRDAAKAIANDREYQGFETAETEAIQKFQSLKEKLNKDYANAPAVAPKEGIPTLVVQDAKGEDKDVLVTPTELQEYKDSNKLVGDKSREKSNDIDRKAKTHGVPETNFKFVEHALNSSSPQAQAELQAQNEKAQKEAPTKTGVGR